MKKDFINVIIKLNLALALLLNVASPSNFIINEFESLNDDYGIEIVHNKDYNQ